MSAQLQFDFDKCTCKNCQHTGATVRFCFMRYGANGDFEHITPDNYCKDFYSVDLPHFDDKNTTLKNAQYEKKMASHI